MSEYFPEPKSSGGRAKVELDQLNFVWLYNKNRFKKPRGVDTLSSANKINLANLKSDVDKIDIDKLKKCTKWFKQFKK